MALIAKDKIHQNQIDAGTRGRNKGHAFEQKLAASINALSYEDILQLIDSVKKDYDTHFFINNPAKLLMSYILINEDVEVKGFKAKWLGGLATSGEGDIMYDSNGKRITSCKSDVLISLDTTCGKKDIGVSVKHCSKKSPTNDQMYFTTASAFCKLLRDNSIPVSDEAEKGMKMFCGDEGYRPLDNFSAEQLAKRTSDPRRYYWEETSDLSQNEWLELFKHYQDKITDLLFRKAYKNDLFAPNYLLHQVVKYDSFDACPTAIFTIDEIVKLSRDYGEFMLEDYKIHKGTYKNDNTVHKAPRFGFIQFQRGGQKQHPTQLQFNLKSGYYKKIKKI